MALQHARRLLDSGARHDEPSDELIAAAEHLQRDQIIEFRIREYVRCAEPRDRDFPPRNRSCQGRIYLDDSLDEDGNEIRCPACDRPVRPYSLEKLRHRNLQTTVSHDGAVAWVRARLEELSSDVRELESGAFRVADVGDLGIVVCVVDADGCADSRFNSRDYAITNPVCYVTIDPRTPEARLLNDGWMCHVGLADLVACVINLDRTLAELAEAPSTTSVAKVDIPVCAKGHVHIQPEQAPQPDRVFFVELCDSVVRINGEVIINPQAGPRLVFFRILWKQFLEDLAEGLAAEAFRAMNMRTLLVAMEERGHRPKDETNLRRVINNAQSEIEKAVKRKLGLPIGREDIVQTCRVTTHADTTGGYRLNPFSVAVRPSQAQ